MLLKIENLKKNYEGVQALDGISLSLEAGTVIGLAGDNGAGKSTLMKCITGAEIPDEGCITFNGKVLSPGDPHHSRSAGIEMVYQDLDLYPRQNTVFNIFSGRESLATFGNVRLPFLDKKGMEKTAKSVIEQLNAGIDVRKNVGSLSGGQRQAVAIARSLLCNPRLLIMDEPTAALGVQEVEKVLELIRTLKKQGIAVILVSHRLTDIFDVADRVVLMRHGKFYEDKNIADTSLQELTQKILAK